MSVYKQFISQDVLITPFNVEHKFGISSSKLIDSNYGVDFFGGIYVSGTIFNPDSAATTGLISSQYKRNIYDSIKQLYYTNYIPNNDLNFFAPTQSYSPKDAADLSLFLPFNHRFNNSLSSPFSESRYFPTSSGDTISVISIPSKLFGDSIVPRTFAFTYGTSTIFDDGEGNLTQTSDTTYSAYGSAIYGISIYGDTSGSASKVGNIIYSQGLAIITSGSLTGSADLISSSILTNLPSASLTFSSSMDIYETQYKCTINENEFNYSLNPTLISGSNVVYSGSALVESTQNNSTTYGFVTESYFSPYITTVGLYNNMQELIAVGKLSQPLQSSLTTDTTILINFDK